MIRYYVTDTFITPLGLAFSLAMGILVLLLPRRYVIIAVCAQMCYMTLGNRFVVGGLTFYMLRILFLFACARLLLREEFHSLKMGPIDKTFLVFLFSSILTYTLLWGSYDAFKHKLGFVYNAMFFFVFRFWLRDREDVVRVIKGLAVLIVPLALLFLLEKHTGNDPFQVFGTIPMDEVRSGAIRCQGPFAHPILAGSFGATIFPLFMGLYAQGKSKRAAAMVGMACSLILVGCAGSSGPAFAGLAGAAAFFAWKIRRHMRQIRWIAAGGLCFLALIMKAPVWFLMARVRVFGGSTGWHRAHLIDMAYQHLSNWWLLGSTSYDTWDPSYLCNWDITNQYIAHGVEGGLITMSLFILIIVFCFRSIGRALRNTENGPENVQIMLWALGASLFAHAVNFLSISYFDQNVINWYLLLALISTSTGLYVTGPARTSLGWASVTGLRSRAHAAVRAPAANRIAGS